MDRVRAVPNDDELERIFRSNREDFEKLRRMSDEDSKVVRIAYDFTWVGDPEPGVDMTQPGFSEERWDDYKTIFRRIHLDGGISRGRDGSVWFDAYSFGLGVSGLRKGYVFSKSPLDCTNTSLDPPKIREGGNRECKELAENWYLFVSN